MPAARPEHLPRFKDLALDATDPERLGRFWAAVLDLTWHAHDDGDGHLSGRTPENTIWVNAVPEPKTVKHRVHLDVYTRDLDGLVALGATVRQPFERWTVMADPEGGEFCAFVRDEMPPDRLHGLEVDAADARAAARWWADVYDATLTVRDGWVELRDVPGMPMRTMDFADVPEPKRGKNRVHWDVVADTAMLVSRGATLLRARDEEIRWDVLADPEGNEFCAFSPDE